MIRTALLSLALLAPLSALAQEPAVGAGDGSSIEDDSSENDLSGPIDLGEVEEVAQPDAAIAAGALLRGLDRVSGELADLTVSNGGTGRLGPLEITLGECRYPVDNPSGDAFAYLTIRSDGGSVPVFEGWMIASSPALNALDHRRYDVWVLRCINS